MKTSPLFLFVCTENACRSQIAEGLCNALTQKARAMSAGTKPSEINPMAIEIMRDRVDIAHHASKPLTKELVDDSFRVVTMGCLDGCPFTPPEKTIKWNIPDPKGKEKEFFLLVRDQIEREVLLLLQQFSFLEKK